MGLPPPSSLLLSAFDGQRWPRWLFRGKRREALPTLPLPQKKGGLGTPQTPGMGLPPPSSLLLSAFDGQRWPRTRGGDRRVTQGLPCLETTRCGGFFRDVYGLVACRVLAERGRGRVLRAGDGGALLGRRRG